MSEKLIKYVDYIVQHQLRNDSGVQYVRGVIQGDLAVWVLAVRRYSQTMGESERGYLTFRKRWAWTDDRVEKYLASSDGASLRQRLKDMSKYFQEQSGMSDYVLAHGALGRSLDTQIKLWKQNWSVKKLGPDLIDKLNKELEKYPDPPTEESAGRFYGFIRTVKLAPVDNPKTKKKVEKITSPTNAAPGLSDHGRMSAIDFVVKKNSKAIAGADTAEIPVWRAPRDGGLTFEKALELAADKLNKATGGVVFDGPLSVPDEPWHYTYVPLAKAEEKKHSADKTPTD